MKEDTEGRDTIELSDGVDTVDEPMVFSSARRVFLFRCRELLRLFETRLVEL